MEYDLHTIDLKRCIKMNHVFYLLSDIGCITIWTSGSESSFLFVDVLSSSEISIKFVFFISFALVTKLSSVLCNCACFSFSISCSKKNNAHVDL